MIATEHIRDVFSILHDGTISAWAGNRDLLTLTVDCPYLAERIDKSFDKFFVELTKVEELFLSAWPHSLNSPAKTLTELNDIFKARLKILSADIKDGKVIISCNQDDAKFDYCGGNLTISSRFIKVYDQNKRELSIEEFELVAKTYWEEWSKK